MCRPNRLLTPSLTRARSCDDSFAQKRTKVHVSGFLVCRRRTSRWTGAAEACFVTNIVPQGGLIRAARSTQTFGDIRVEPLTRRRVRLSVTKLWKHLLLSFSFWLVSQNGSMAAQSGTQRIPKLPSLSLCQLTMHVDRHVGRIVRVQIIPTWRGRSFAVFHCSRRLRGRPSYHNLGSLCFTTASGHSVGEQVNTSRGCKFRARTSIDQNYSSLGASNPSTTILGLS